MMKKEDVLAICIEAVRNGSSTAEECLVRYPEFRQELEPLLRLAASLPAGVPGPSPEFKYRARSRLLAEMAASEARRQRRIWPQRVRAILRPSLAALIVTALLMSGGGSAIYASQNSLPDDTLYPVKLGVEQVRLVLAGNDRDKATLRLELAGRRIDEVLEQSERQRPISTGALDRVGSQLDNAVKHAAQVPAPDSRLLAGEMAVSTVYRQIDLLSLLESEQEDEPAIRLALDTLRRANLIARTAYSTPSFLQQDPSVLDEDLEAGQFSLSGMLTESGDANWNIGGLQLTNVVSPHDEVSTGSYVTIRGLSSNSQVYIIEVEYGAAGASVVRIEGSFEGSSSDGSQWYISGVTVQPGTTQETPTAGQRLEVSGSASSGTLSATQVQVRRDNHGELEGRLTAVDVPAGTIEILQAGTRHTVNVSQASISSDDTPLALADLSLALNTEVEAGGLRNIDGVLWASRLEVELDEDDEESGNTSGQHDSDGGGDGEGDD